jgi:predicted Zn-dependent protease
MIRFAAISPKTRHDSWAFRSYLALAIALTSGTLGCAVSQQSEVQMGSEYAAQIEKELPLVRDAEVLSYINLVGDSLARVVDDRALTWHFNIVNSRDFNAFAVPGGYIYINRGLIERANNLSEVAGVIGHEIGHITKRHSIKQMQKAQGANVGVGVACILTNICNSEASQAAINIAASGIFAKFSRDDETEADEEGVKTLARAGIDPQGMPDMFQILLNERKTRPDQVSVFFASHPMEEDRIAFTKGAIAKLPPPTRRLTRDTPNFQAFKRRLMSLPAPPATVARKQH